MEDDRLWWICAVFNFDPPVPLTKRERKRYQAFWFFLMEVYYLVGGFKHFLFSPLPGGNDPIWLYHIFQIGWNHQLVVETVDRGYNQFGKLRRTTLLKDSPLRFGTRKLQGFLGDLLGAWQCMMDLFISHPYELWYKNWYKQYSLVCNIIWLIDLNTEISQSLDLRIHLGSWKGWY